MALHSRRMVVTGLFFMVVTNGFSVPYETLGKKFDRTKSKVMVRKVDRPTLANLDYAMYTANPIRFDPLTMTPRPPVHKAVLADMTFGGMLADACLTIENTPLTAAEKEQPLAWEALQNRLWEITKSDAFSRITSAINGAKWADPSVYAPYQEIVALYLHDENGETSLWAKIEFKPWVKFLQGIGDADKDGYREIYGRLNTGDIDPAVVSKAVAWIRSDYQTALLNRAQVTDWANVLASYWYPKLNTDIVNVTNPEKRDQPLVNMLSKLPVSKNQIVAIRGTPSGKPLYNVLIVAALEEKQAAEGGIRLPEQPAQAGGPLDTSVSDNYKSNNLRFELETKINGDYTDWLKKDAPFRSAMAAYVNSLPAAQMGFAGKDGWLFFKNEINYLNCSDIGAQKDEVNPLPRLVELKKYLADRNVALLFCAVPNKSDVYFDKLPGKGPEDPAAIVNPMGRKFLRDLQAAGVEVIDLLPAFLEAKKSDSEASGPLFQKRDTHWTTRGLQVAAEIIAGRMRQYAWYSGVPRTAYATRDTFILRQGDLVDRLPESERIAYPADSLNAVQVLTPDGALYKAINRTAPVVLMGDSFTGVFELVDCKGAGVGSHIAARTGVPVEIITSWGGGPLVREMMLRTRKNNLGSKRVVVYMMVSRDLWNYGQKWTKIIAD